jgi:hypothetical protein
MYCCLVKAKNFNYKIICSYFPESKGIQIYDYYIVDDDFNILNICYSSDDNYIAISAN